MTVDNRSVEGSAIYLVMAFLCADPYWRMRVVVGLVPVTRQLLGSVAGGSHKAEANLRIK